MILSRQAIYTVQTTGYNLYCLVVRDQDTFILNPTSEKFVIPSGSTAITSAIVLTEHAIAKGLYSKTDLTKLKDGKYIVVVYHKAGSDPTPASDTIVDRFYYFVKTEMKHEFHSTLGILG